MTQQVQTVPPGSAVAPKTARLERTRQLVTAALVTAVMVATGWISIPFGPVPVSLQVFGVALAALLLAPGWAAASMAVYVLLGAAGVPVFANGHAGLGVILGPTGGYVTGFVLGAFLGSLGRTWVARRRVRALAGDVTAVTIVIAIVYAVGWAQLAYVLHLSASAAFIAGVVPFFVPDAVKALLAIVIARSVRRAVAPE